MTVARLTGEFGGSRESEAAAPLMSLVATAGSRVAVDVSGLQAIDSTGLSMLMNLVARGRLNDSRVVLVAPSPFVAGVLRVTKLDTWLEIRPDLDAAEKAMCP